MKLARYEPAVVSTSDGEYIIVIASCFASSYYRSNISSEEQNMAQTN